MAREPTHQLQKKAVHYGELGLFKHVNSEVLKAQGSTGYTQVNSLTTAERDALTPANGMLIYNETLGKFQFYQNGEWVSKAESSWKSYQFTSRGVGAGTYFAAGYYEAPAADANLTQAGTTVTLGAANVPYAAHAFLVAAAAGTATGGSGAVTIVCSGTSITDAGTRTTSDTETIVADITTMSTDEYFETDKKWIGQVVYTLTVGATGHTAYAADFNYGYDKYEDFGNQNFTLTDFEAVGLAAANDGSFNIELLHHSSADWTYSAAAFVPGGTVLIAMETIHSTESDVDNGVAFAFKRAAMSTAISGSASEGLVIRVTTGANNTVQFLDMHIGMRI